MIDSLLKIIKDPNNPRNWELFNKLSAEATDSFNTQYKNIYGQDPPNDKQTGDLRNAYGHAYASAKLTYDWNSDIALALGYYKEISTEDEEKRRQSTIEQAIIDLPMLRLKV